MRPVKSLALLGLLGLAAAGITASKSSTARADCPSTTILSSYHVSQVSLWTYKDTGGPVEDPTYDTGWVTRDENETNYPYYDTDGAEDTTSNYHTLWWDPTLGVWVLTYWEVDYGSFSWVTYYRDDCDPAGAYEYHDSYNWVPDVIDMSTPEEVYLLGPSTMP